MKSLRSAGSILCLVAMIGSCASVRADCRLDTDMTGRVAVILDAETIGLSGGAQVRLINMLSPRRPLWLKPDARWPAAESAVTALKRLVAGREIELSFEQARTDRHGRLRAQVHVLTPQGRLWVQGEMIGKGLARVYSLPSSRNCARSLFTREVTARRQGLGLWRMAFYAIRPAVPAGEIIKLKNSFGVVEGVVHTVARVGPRVFLNFEKEWKSDFTVILEQQAVRLFKNAAIDPAELEGTRIRVRGWVKTFNGPMIEASHPEQIELVDE